MWRCNDAIIIYLARFQFFFKRGLLPYSDPLLALLKSFIFIIANAAKKKLQFNDVWMFRR